MRVSSQSRSRTRTGDGPSPSFPLPLSAWKMHLRRPLTRVRLDMTSRGDRSSTQIAQRRALRVAAPHSTSPVNGADCDTETGIADCFSDRTVCLPESMAQLVGLLARGPRICRARQLGA